LLKLTVPERLWWSVPAPGRVGGAAMDIAVAAIHAGVDVPVAHGANPRWRVVEHHVHRLKEVPLVRRAVFGFADSRLDFTASATMPDNTPCARSTVVAPASLAPMLAIHDRRAVSGADRRISR